MDVATAPQLLVVDTNAYLRLFHSSVRPLLGVEMDGYKLVVTRDLVDEFYGSTRLQEIYGWAANSPYKEELEAAVLKLDPPVAAVIAADAVIYRQSGDAVLEDFCNARGLEPVRTLSRQDATLLATVLELGAALVTDEWPLKHVADAVEADENGNVLKTLTSLDVLSHCEKCGKMTREERVDTVKSWMRNGDLPFQFFATYETAFGERAPSVN